MAMTEDIDKKNEDLQEKPEGENLDRKSKLDKLNLLIQKSQVYSQIMADTIREATKKKTEETSQDDPVRQKRKRHKGNSDIVEMLSKPSALSSVRPQPSIMKGKLKDYQLDGLEWLITLYENGLNGILADEMGLGKTIQCIAFLSFLIENGVTGPFLIIAPLSTVSNWISEFSRFSPSVNCLTYVGSKENRSKISLRRKFNVLITSYEISMRDFAKLNNVTWKYMVIDEGHRLKNHNCTLIKTLRRLHVSNKLLITGTPLQNDLAELWSLLNFILPDFFHDLDLFEKWFDFDELTNLKEEDGDDEKLGLKIKEQLIKSLHTILKPFILRRVKSEVNANLPPKKEYLIHITMSNLQRKLYKDCLEGRLFDGLLEAYLKEYFYYEGDETLNSERIDQLLQAEKEDDGLTQRKTSLLRKESEKHGNKKETTCRKSLDSLLLFDKKYHQCMKELRSLSLQNLVIQLRNICNSPYVFYDPTIYAGDSNDKFFEILLKNSSKFAILNQLLDNLLPNKHKVLVFSQFTRVLDLISDFLDYKGLSFCRLDGSTSQEERVFEIKEFNSRTGKESVFLLSTRAGGLGINLMAADTVIIFDNDWNPQVDLQAIDRVHRIGQTKPVKVFRFLVRNSIEEILISKAYSKRFLEKLVLRKGQFRLKNFQKAIHENDIDMKGLVELSKRFQINGEENDDFTMGKDTKWEVSDHSMPELLSKEELKELFDRSDACFTRETQFKNITSFETLNNLDKN